MKGRNESRSRKSKRAAGPKPRRGLGAAAGKGGPPPKSKPGKLRIIGGQLRGHSVRYHGAPFTRPMKDSVRENLFNILGRAVRGAVVWDFFAGTGVLSFEAISRGAASVVAVEQSRQAVRTIRESAESLGVAHQLRVVTGDAFRLADRLLVPPEDDTPWVVFLCPPYRMWEDESDLESLGAIIRRVAELAPPGSVLAAETDKRFDVGRLPPGDWDFRVYGSTRLGLLEPAMRCGLDPSPPTP